jgi:hypothetical protein
MTEWRCPSCGRGVPSDSMEIDPDEGFLMCRDCLDRKAQARRAR